MLEQLKIDEEFRTVLPPLTEEEFNQLEELIVSENEVREAIVVWNDVIVDGHNRWAILQKHPDIPHRIKQKEFADRWEVIDWIISTQNGRRNCTSEQKTYLLGKLYEARKHTHGETQERGDDGTYRSRKNCGNGKQTFPNGRTKRVADIIAEEQGVGARTINDAYSFSQGIDTIRKEDPELANEILSGKKSVTKKDVAEVRKKKPEEVKEVIKAIKDGTTRQKPKPKTDEEMELIANISNDIATSRTATVYVPTIDDLVNEIKANIEPYIEMMNRTIDGYADVIRGKSEVLISAIDTNIIAKFNEMKEKIKNVYA